MVCPTTVSISITSEIDVLRETVQRLAEGANAQLHAEQTHEVVYEPQTRCVFVSQMSNSVLAGRRRGASAAARRRVAAAARRRVAAAA